MKDKGESRVVLKFPSASSLKVGAMSYAWDRACFAINITAPDITARMASSCEISRGVFSGTVAPNSQISATVSRGTGRKLEIFAYLRNSSTESCPALADGFGSLDRAKIARVGVVESFDVQSDEVNLSVSVAPPTAADMVASLYQMSSTCTATSIPPGASAGRMVAGAGAVASGGGFKIRQRLSFKTEDPALTSSGGTYKIKGSLKVEGL